MNNKELFKSTFIKVRVDENKVKEIIKMKDTKKIKKPYAKKIIAIAACIGCALSAAMAVNAATDGEIAKEVTGWFANADGKVTKEIIGWFVNADGEKIPLEVITHFDENGCPNEKIYCSEINTNDTSEQVISDNVENYKIYGGGEIHFY